MNFEFEDDFDDFESYQKRQKINKHSNDNTSNYYAEYFSKKNNENDENEFNETSGRKLKKPKGPRKTENEKKTEKETKRLNFEYKVIGGIILGFTSMIGFAWYYIMGSKIGKADNYYKLAVDYELKIEHEKDDNTINNLISKADYYYKKSINYTDVMYPKYLYAYSNFLLTHKKEYQEAELYIQKALGLHSTNAIYHKFYCKLLKELIENQDKIERIIEYNHQIAATLNAHILEAKYFLSEEDNEHAAMMHFDYGLELCSDKYNIKNPNKSDNNYHDNIRFKKDIKLKLYEQAAILLNEYGHNSLSQKYWDDGIADQDISSELHIKYGVYLIQQQKFNEAQNIFQYYIKINQTKTSTIDITAQVFSARIFMELGEYSKAMDLYSKILPKVGLQHMVISDMVYILIETNQLRHANNLLKKYLNLIKKDPNYKDITKVAELIPINMMNVLLYGATNDIEKGNLYCLEMVKNHPNSYEANYYAAKYHHLYSKNYEKADTYYRTAISIEESWAKTYYDYSQLLKGINDLASYIKYIKIAYEKNKEIPKINKEYNRVYDENGALRAKIINQM